MIHFVNKYICVYVCVSFSLTAYYSWMIFSIMLLRNCKIYINVHGFIELSTFRGDWFWMKQCTLFHLLLRHVRMYLLQSYKIYYYNRNAIYIYSFEKFIDEYLDQFCYITIILLYSFDLFQKYKNKNKNK